ncbi:polyprenyl synthetase family protein [Metabacillus sediminilitoris]|uniref:Isoprenyl transferase n=1 Tax=Metabacillus sediminilitoris TaxID=2567941 RepID=A0A4S4C217_9BACI|nr:polyprenyl synthetase family protein [Metabacillus sediminilitoris]QGQ47842.1 isoprenyl transferase [Metabacillus sediminilitoris]THF81045.1 isoprenyl transferase [Metabacillus sediminilitoris]
MVVIAEVESQSIKRHMLQSISSQLEHSELQDLLFSFVEDKQIVNFGQLAIIHHEAFGGKDSEIIQLAAAIELLILSFDMFDDLEDLDNMKELWMQIDRSIAINAATTLYTISQQTVLNLSSPYKHQVLSAFLQFSMKAMEGQHDDLQNLMSTEEECLHVMKRKAGSLIALASVSGMLLAGANFPEVEEYSYQVGIAAQADNDFRDLFNLNKNDITSKKKSLAYLYLEKGYNEHSHVLMKFIESGREIIEEFGSIENYKQILFDSGVMQYLNVIKQVAINRAKKKIESLDIKEIHIEKIKSHLIINKKPTNKER